MELYISGRNRSDVPRMDLDENREWREGELLRAQVREDAGADEKPDVGGHRGESRESRGNRTDPETVQVRAARRQNDIVKDVRINDRINKKRW